MISEFFRQIAGDSADTLEDDGGSWERESSPRPEKANPTKRRSRKSKNEDSAEDTNEDVEAVSSGGGRNSTKSRHSSNSPRKGRQSVSPSKRTTAFNGSENSDEGISSATTTTRTLSTAATDITSSSGKEGLGTPCRSWH